VRTVHAVAVALSRLDVGDEPVPDESVDLGQHDTLGLLAVGVEQAQLHPLGGLAEQREIGTKAVVRRPEGIGLARPYFVGDVRVWGCGQSARS
jgi:hypothetical protein